MLFHSFAYLLVFLPVTVAGFFLASKSTAVRLRLLWLVLVSLFFYAFSNPANLLILAGSTIANYAIGLLLQSSIRAKRVILIAGITGNILTLGVFKYSAFAIATFNQVFNMNLAVPAVILPLAISFITFQKIAFLVDVYRGKTQERDFLHFCAFSTFFPQLIAGPIIRHREYAPQCTTDTLSVNARNIMIGLTLIVAGLCKKILIADALSPSVDTLFKLADNGSYLSFIEAWAAALGYTFQLYFDFSGYTDMAAGSARLFGITLPLNFNSPYKSASIVEFWRRWHITLSRFLRDYLYFSLGGNRKGKLRQYMNLFLTMTVGGLWHGAGWTFVFWGMLHGAFLIINHGWRALKKPAALTRFPPKLSRLLAQGCTFIAIVIAWVFFRASTFGGAWRILAAMSGKYGVQLPEAAGQLAPLSSFWLRIGVHFQLERFALVPVSSLLYSGILILIAAALCFLAPNIYQLLHDEKPVLETAELNGSPVRFKPSGWTALCLALATFAVSVSIVLSQPSEFLYFRF